MACFSMFFLIKIMFFPSVACFWMKIMFFPSTIVPPYCNIVKLKNRQKSLILKLLFLGISFWKVILRQSGGSKFQKFSPRRQPWWHLGYILYIFGEILACFSKKNHVFLLIWHVFLACSLQIYTGHPVN